MAQLKFFSGGGAILGRYYGITNKYPSHFRRIKPLLGNATETKSLMLGTHFLNELKTKIIKKCYFKIFTVTKQK